MQRICFVLQVKKDRLEEYKERHRAVWPEMTEALRKTGWHNYSLFSPLRRAARRISRNK
jgi:L-rhamnose mutarotase